MFDAFKIVTAHNSSKSIIFTDLGILDVTILHDLETNCHMQLTGKKYTCQGIQPKCIQPSTSPAPLEKLLEVLVVYENSFSGNMWINQSAKTTLALQKIITS